jgi:hypothetical protein
MAQLETYTFWGNQLIDVHDLGWMLLKLFFDLIFTLAIMRAIFYPIYKERDYFFTAIVINVAIFFICFFMESIQLKLGFAFGLFAIFGIMRYRTEQIPIRQMTYMFAVIIIAVLNSLAGDKISYAELLLANTAIVLTILLLEKNILHNDESVKFITYEKIELIRPENYTGLISDLRKRTGLYIKRAEIDSINFLNDTAKLKILFHQPGNSKLTMEIPEERIN